MYRRTLAALAALFIVNFPCAQAQGLGPEMNFPGDDLISASTGDQINAAIAPGGPGFLVVWQDHRTAVTDKTPALGLSDYGNQIDIYAARYDQDGNRIDEEPLLIANQGMDQVRPTAAWNGSEWLVVFETQQPDWYFNRNIVGVRVAGDGTVLDADPILIRQEKSSPANDYGKEPAVSSDGTNWFVVWTGFDFTLTKQMMEGTRVSPNGTLLDPTYKRLYTWTDPVFGPENPQISFLASAYLLVWNDDHVVRTLRLDTSLNAIGPVQTIPNLWDNVRLATAPHGHLLMISDWCVRLAPDGTLLDTIPIVFPKITFGGGQVNSPVTYDAAWNGTSWSLGYAVSPSGPFFGDRNVYMTRIGADGSILDPAPLLVTSDTADDKAVRLAGIGGGKTLFAYDSRPDGFTSLDNIKTTVVDANGAPQAAQVASAGLARQENLTWVENGTTRLAVWVSRKSEASEILAQRFDENGTPIDLTPSLVHQAGETLKAEVSAAWNGSAYLIVWLDANRTVRGTRLDAGLLPIDAAPVALMTNMDGAPAVGSLNGNYLVASSRITMISSESFSTLYGMRIDGAAWAPLDTPPFVISPSYATRPVIAAFAGNYLVAYDFRGCHDCSSDRVLARQITSAGVVSAAIQINGPGKGASADIALAEDRALITYSDPTVFNHISLEGRIMMANGSLLGGEILIANENNTQIDGSCVWDGNQFVVAWTDNRQNFGVEQRRGDIYMSRLALDGTLLDPLGGVQVTSGVLPEDHAAVTGGSGKAIVAYSRLGRVGGAPEVQRNTYRILNGDICQPNVGFGGPGTATLSICGDPLVGTSAVAEVRVDSDMPFSIALIGYGPNSLPTPLFGGMIVPAPLAGYLFKATNATGDVAFPISPLPNPLALFAQALVVDPTQPGGFQITNAVLVTMTP